MKFNIMIRGNNALLLHKYTVATASNPKTRVIKNRDSVSYADEWIKGTYLNKDGNVVMPSLNIMACLFDGCKGMKTGKKALTRIIYTSLWIMPLEPVLTYEGKTINIDTIRENDWLHMSGAVISGRRIDRVRTMIPEGWELSFQITQKDESLSAEDIKMIVENAGKAAGLGDWRPSSPKKPGAYGTFELVKMEPVK